MKPVRKNRQEPRRVADARSPSRVLRFPRRDPAPGTEGMAPLERIAWLLDSLIEIPFLRIRFGLDALLGLVPWAGDTVASVLSLYIVASAVRHRVPKLVIARMALNVAIDYLVSLVPVAGDVGDVFISSNRWNVELLRRYSGGIRRPSAGDVAFVALAIGLVVAVMAGAVTLLVLLARAIAPYMPQRLL
jgi:hypothetical protein